MNDIGLIDVDGDIVPVLAGTHVPVHEIAALLEGQSVAEILEDYPGLTQEQVRFAAAYAAGHPDRDHAFPRRSFKRALGDAAASGLWDVDEIEEPIAPRPIP